MSCLFCKQFITMITKIYGVCSYRVGQKLYQHLCCIVDIVLFYSSWSFGVQMPMSPVAYAYALYLRHSTLKSRNGTQAHCTPPTRLNWVASAVWTVNAAVDSRDPVYNFLCFRWQMTTLWRHCWKSYQYRSKSTQSNRHWVCLVSFQIVDRIRRQSSWASCEFCSHRRRRRHSTRRLSRVVCIWHYYTPCSTVYWWLCCSQTACRNVDSTESQGLS